MTTLPAEPRFDELLAARERALGAALAALGADRSPAAEYYRQQFRKRLTQQRLDHTGDAASRPVRIDIRRAALNAARQAIIDMRSKDEIGDDAFHRIEQELDWIEMAGGSSSDVAS